MSALLLKVAFAGIRRRPLQALLVVAVVLAASMSLAVAVSIDDVADRPFDRTFEAVRGAHVRASGPHRDRERLRRLEQVDGVVASTGLRDMAFTGFLLEGKRFGLRLFELPRAPSTVDVPVLVSGRLPAEREVVLERSFATTLGLEPGDVLELGSRGLSVQVAGIVVIGQSEAYPLSQPGAAIGAPGLLTLVVPDTSRWLSYVGVRLSDPGLAATVAVPGAIAVDTWLSERQRSTEWLQLTRVIFGLFSALLVLTAGAVLATLVGGRVLAQLRDVGLLKAAGMSPSQVAATIGAELSALALAGALAGVLLSRAVGAVFVPESPSLLAASATPPLRPLTAFVVVAAVTLVATAFAFVPAWRAASRTTVDVLAAAAGRAGARSAPGTLAARLGLPPAVVLGVRDVFSRPARSWLLAATLALVVASAVATLGGEASLRVGAKPPPAPLVAGLDLPRWDPIDGDLREKHQIRRVVFALDAVLLITAGANMIAAMLLGVRERRRDFSMLKAVGMTPGEIRGGFLAGQAALALPAVVAGLPLGYALFRAAVQAGGGADEFAYPDWWAVVLVLPATVAAVLALAAPLAGAAARVRVADGIRFE